MDARTPRAHTLPCPRRRIALRLRHIGYVGQNLTLDLTTNRTLRLASLGPERVAQVIEANLTALLEILRWNARQGIRLFRVGSSVIPFASHERFELDWEERFAGQLGQVRPNEAIHWYALRYWKARGMEWHDWGGGMKYKEKYGVAPVGTYSYALAPKGDALYVTWNANRSGRAWDVCALSVIHIPETERKVE